MYCIVLYIKWKMNIIYYSFFIFNMSFLYLFCFILYLLIHYSVDLKICFNTILFLLNYIIKTKRMINLSETNLDWNNINSILNLSLLLTNFLYEEIINDNSKVIAFEIIAYNRNFRVIDTFLCFTSNYNWYY